MTGASSRTSLVSSEDEKSADDIDKDDSLLKPEEKSDDAPKFKSPLLQKLTDKSQNGDSGTPKFKSPLLQSIMGKTKIGARLSATRLDEMDKSTDNLSESKSVENLSMATSMDDMTASRSLDNLSDKEIVVKQKEADESEKDRDTSEAHILANGVHDLDTVCDSSEKILADESSLNRSDDIPQQVESDSPTRTDVISDSMTTSMPPKDLIGSTADSAVSLSFTTNGVTTSQNGDLHLDHKDMITSKDLLDLVDSR